MDPTELDLVCETEPMEDLVAVELTTAVCAGDGHGPGV
jgi:hypothetical protein